jgi:hypothetical protein
MNNKTRKETPSAKAIFLNQLYVFVDFIHPLNSERLSFFYRPL